MITKLENICTLSFGPYLSSVSDVGVSYLQVKNFLEDGTYLSNVENYVSSEDLKDTMLLKQDDILFVSKGMKFLAYKYNETIGPAVASSIFYVIKVDAQKILPDYLVCLLNNPKSLSYFYNASAGTSIPSIRKKELLDFTIYLPSISDQHKIVDIYLCHLEQIQLLNKIKSRKQNFFDQLITNIANNKITI